ncbi:DUF6541 family protein [Pseudarthrobacter quantipunctorum]|uniref:DUF6541 family protein n=1 Tax=Pseudarthrobacter quantipunctorum TaxID=3128980 RepID=A0ABZ2R8N1_9MICC
MSWWSTLPLLIATLAILFIPGVLIGWASGLRDFSLVALAPALAVSTLAIAGMVAPVLGLTWSPLPVLLVAVLVALVALLVSRQFREPVPQQSRPPANWRLLIVELLAVAIGTLLIGRRLVAVFGQPEAFSQTFDNVFHLNAIRYIVDTGSASSFSIAGMTGGSGFYPAAWHDIVSLLVGLTATPIPVGVNVVNLVVGAVIWPVGCIFLVQQIVGRDVLASLSAGVLSAAFGVFPIMLMDFGVLYPLALGISLLPITLGVCLQLLGKSETNAFPKVVGSLLLLAILPGLALAHTSCVMALMVILVPVVLVLWWGRVKAYLLSWRSTWRYLGLYITGLILAFGMLFLTWDFVRPAEVAAFWPPIQTTGRAIGEVITSSAMGRPVSWAVALLAVVGLYERVKRRDKLWVVGMYFVVGFLFVVVSSMPFGDVRTFITGVWYNDPPRLAALLPVLILPVAVMGTMHLADLGARQVLPKLRTVTGPSLQHQLSGAPRYSGGALVALLLVGLVWTTQQANVRQSQSAAAPGYQATEASPLLSSDELALIDRLDEHVPPDAVLLGNPWNGSPLAYALVGRKTLQLHILSAVPQGGEILYERLNRAKSDPSVCPAVRELRAKYVLDFGHKEVHGGDHGFRGLDDLAGNAVGTLIDQQGDAKLYKLTGCD